MSVININEEELASLLQIDKHALDDDLISQPDLYHRVSHAVSLAESKRDEAAENIKYVEAQLDLDIRQEAENNGDKVTEKYVAAQVQASDKRQKAVKDHLHWKHRAQRLQALQESFRQRGYMLRELVQLYISNYWMDSSVSAKNESQKIGAEKARYSQQRKKIAGKRKASGGRKRLRE